MAKKKATAKRTPRKKKPTKRAPRKRTAKKTTPPAAVGPTTPDVSPPAPRETSADDLHAYAAELLPDRTADAVQSIVDRAVQQADPRAYVDRIANASAKLDKPATRAGRVNRTPTPPPAVVDHHQPPPPAVERPRLAEVVNGNGAQRTDDDDDAAGETNLESGQADADQLGGDALPISEAEADAETERAVYARCATCGHVWKAADLPTDVAGLADAAAAGCPKCGEVDEVFQHTPGEETPPPALPAGDAVHVDRVQFVTIQVPIGDLRAGGYGIGRGRPYKYLRLSDRRLEPQHGEILGRLLLGCQREGVAVAKGGPDKRVTKKEEAIAFLLQSLYDAAAVADAAAAE